VAAGVTVAVAAGRTVAVAAGVTAAVTAGVTAGVTVAVYSCELIKPFSTSNWARRAFASSGEDA
jgi:hypothetical protein